MKTKAQVCRRASVRPQPSGRRCGRAGATALRRTRSHAAAHGNRLRSGRTRARRKAPTEASGSTPGAGTSGNVSSEKVCIAPTNVHARAAGHRRLADRDRDGAAGADHLRQRAGALLHQPVLRLDRGVLGLPDDRAVAGGRLGRRRAQPAHPHRVLRRQRPRMAPARAGPLRRADGVPAVRADRGAERARGLRRHPLRRDLARHRRAAVVVHDLAAGDVGGHRRPRAGPVHPPGAPE
jgi:hypothetical protein